MVRCSDKHQDSVVFAFDASYQGKVTRSDDESGIRLDMKCYCVE